MSMDRPKRTPQRHTQPPQIHHPDPQPSPPAPAPSQPQPDQPEPETPTTAPPTEAAEIRSRALKLLTTREHSCYELWRKLYRRGYPAEAINIVLDLLATEGLLSEERMLAAYVTERLNYLLRSLTHPRRAPSLRTLRHRHQPTPQPPKTNSVSP
jgi:Uncharacterized protein conserved in bacteria